MANLALSHPAEPRSTVPSGTTIFIAAIFVAWFAVVAVVGARGGFVTPPGVPPLPILLGFLTPLVVFLAGYWLSRPIRQLVLAIDPRLMMAMQAWRFAGLGFLALYTYGVLPGFFALPAGLGDITIGVTAPWLLVVLMRQPSFAASRTFVIWNLLGILDLVVAMGTGALGTILVAGADTGVGTGAMAQMPLVLIPAFFVPVLFALHASALFQARRFAANHE
ncbi:MAG TPA: hypothetical protein VN326_15900 [Casimicrobiaceae bacterium]|nr:hypothetical protein [Casimicrobiaceae bacterium]